MTRRMENTFYSKTRFLKITGGIVCGVVFSLAAAAQSVEQLPLDQVVRNLEQRNAQRTAALEQFEGERIYRMQYRGIPSDHDAEMVVTVHFEAPNTKEFRVVSASGSKFITEHVFKKLLEGEQEAAKGDNRRQTALTTENYDFEFSGFENSDGGTYVLNLIPKTKNKFLYRGKILVDAKDFAVVRIEGEPGKSPSFWIKKTEIAHKYTKVDEFWLPLENHTESVIRLGGTATLSIEYQNYHIIKATPLGQADSSGRIPGATSVTDELRKNSPSLSGVTQ